MNHRAYFHTLIISMHRIAYAVLLLVTISANALSGQDTQEDSNSAAATKTANNAQEVTALFFKQYCTECHGSTKAENDLTLHDLKSFSSEDDLEKWESVLERVKDGEMPPEDQLQPTDKERAKFVKSIEAKLKLKIAKANPSDRPPLARRLTNIEYENTIADLIGFRLDLIDLLPKDPTKPYQFNNTAELMRMGPEQIQRYLECARKVMASAIVDLEMPKVHKTRREWKAHGVDRGLGADEVGVWGNRRNTPATGMGLKSFPKIGEFKIRMKASAILPNGTTELPLRLVMGYSLGENSSTLRIAPVGTVRLSNNPDNPKIVEFRGRIENHPVRPPRGHRGRTLPPSMAITPQNLYDDGTLNDVGPMRNISMPRAVIEWMEFEAPLTEVWPPKNHSQILFESPLRESNPNAYVRQVLQRFMDRAYRRRASESEVDRFVNVYQLLSREFTTIESAMRETLAMVLVSPQFLYHTVANGNTTSQQDELASRLSYFLWGSMPDAELLQLAQSNKLNDPNVIEQQTRRLLRDPKSKNFVRNFTMQWLSLQKMKTVPINRELFPRFLYYVPRGERAGTEQPYRPTIRDYMIDETVGFIGELIQSNRSMLYVVESDFVFINQPLAAHYGIDGVEGNHFRAVSIKPNHHLGGLLTHGSVLVGNGTGTAPHPIYRAVWLREAILGDEVAPPPAEVPALSDSAGESAEKALSIKDLLEKHRQEKSCNSCHARLDPWGIPFERYNAIGKFQPMVPKEGTRVSGFNAKTHQNMSGYLAYLESINTVKVQANSRVPRGPEVNGMSELKAFLLKEHRDAIANNILRRLLAYSIGRKLDYRDRFVVESILEESKLNDFKFQDAIVMICQSETFRGISADAQNRGATQPLESKPAKDNR